MYKKPRSGFLLDVSSEYQQERVTRIRKVRTLQENGLFCNTLRSTLTIRRARGAPAGSQCYCSGSWELLLLRFAERVFDAELFQLPPR